MPTSKDITPAKFRCASGTCPSIHETENRVVMIGNFVSPSELKNMNITRIGDGESAIAWSHEFLEAFFMEYAARKLAEMQK